MAETVFAAFADANRAEQAAGALLDRGAKPEDISVVVGTVAHSYQSADGITTTTATDVAVGAAKGAGIGAGLGALAVLASLFIPGVGLVVGGGALAAALAAGAGAAVGGAVAGGIAGLLIDQGVSAAHANEYQRIVTGGGAILSISLPTGELARADVDDVLAKYGAAETNAVAHNPVQSQA
jgi:hypothetical protein